MRIILASGSPRRKELASRITKNFEVIVSNANESFQEGLTIEEQSKRIAYLKAKTVFDETEGNRVVIGSDTMVVKDGKTYGKPKDREDAIKMLLELKNARHTVITSLAVLIEKDGRYKEYVDFDKTDVYIKDMTQDEIEHWVDLRKPYDLAGAYAVQSEFGVFVDRIDGNFFTVVGLPIHKLYDVIKSIDK